MPILFLSNFGEIWRERNHSPFFSFLSSKGINSPFLSFLFSPTKRSVRVRLPDEIGKLFHLRYLGFGTRIGELSPSIGNFYALQTLELRDLSFVNHPIQLPDEIRNAKQLRHLVGVFKWPFPVDNLTELRTLRKVVVEAQLDFEPTSLINLRELEVQIKGRDKRFTLDFISGLSSLEALNIEVYLGLSGSFPTLQPLSQCQNLIQMRLKVCGAWKLQADFHQFPPNLKYLLIEVEFTEDPFPVLEKLPNLTILELSYGGDKLVCSAVGFPQLEILRFFHGTSGELEVEEGGMPMLKGLELGGCYLSAISQRLSSIPPPPPYFMGWGWPY